MKKATHQKTKEHNTTLVLQTIYHSEQTSPVHQPHPHHRL